MGLPVQSLHLLFLFESLAVLFEHFLQRSWQIKSLLRVVQEPVAFRYNNGIELGQVKAAVFGQFYVVVEL